MRLLAPWLACLLCACGAGPAPVAELSQRAQPYLALFQRFERWAQRATALPAMHDDRAALMETLFAPVRGRPDVLGAWVQRDGEPPLDLALPESGPVPSLQAASVIRDPRFGTLRVVVRAPCRTQLRAARAPVARCVILAREREVVNGSLRVIAEFTEADPDTAAPRRSQ